MFEGIEFWKAIFIFVGYFFLDVLSSWFILALNRLQLWTTTGLTFLLYIGSGAGIYQYTHNFTYLIFAALGATLGNFFLVWEEINRQKKNNP
jgi:hypothetical protein